MIPIRLFWSAVRIVVSATAILYLSSKYDLLNSLRNLEAENPYFFLAGTMALVVQILIVSVRWRLVLSSLGISAPTVKVVKVSYIASFFNTCLPAGIAGDVVRVWLVRDEHTRLQAAFTSVLVDRIVALLALLFLATVVEPFVWAELSADEALALAIPSLAALGFLGTVMLVNIDRIGAVVRMLRALKAETLATGLSKFSADARTVFRSIPTLAAIFTLGVAGHLTICVAVLALAVGLGLEVTMAQCLLIVPIVLLLMSLPISIGGWGPRELAMVYLFGLFGVPGTQALTLSIEFGLCTVIASLPGAGLWVAWRRSPMRRG